MVLIVTRSNVNSLTVCLIVQSAVNNAAVSVRKRKCRGGNACIQVCYLQIKKHTLKAQPVTEWAAMVSLSGCI